MFRHLLTSSYRFLAKQKTISLICIITAVLGLWGTLPFAESVWYQLTTDRFYKDRDLIYQIKYDRKSSLPSDRLPKAEDFLSYFPEVEYLAPVVIHDWLFNKLISARQPDGSLKIMHENVMRTNDEFFRIIPLRFLTGFDYSWFSKPGNAIMSEESALRFFNTIDVIGREIIVDYEQSYTIVAVYNPSEYSTFKQGIILSCTEPKHGWIPGKEGWLERNIWLVKFRFPPDEAYITQRSKILSETLIPAEPRPLLKVLPFPGPLQIEDDSYLDIFFVILLLFAVTVNYVNLSAGFGLNMAKELGIRRIIGGGRIHLTIRVVIQNLILMSIALIIGIAGYGPFIRLIDSPRPITLFTIIYSACMLGVIILFSSIIPSIFLSAIRPGMSIIQGTKVVKSGKPGGARFALVSIQLAASVILLTLFSIVFINYYGWVSKPLNWNTKNLITINLDFSDSIKSKIYFDRIHDTGIIKDLCFGSSLPIKGTLFSGIGIRTMEKSDIVDGDQIQVDENYFGTLNLELLSGSFQFQKSPTPIWISRSFAEKLNPGEIVSLQGQHIDYFTGDRTKSRMGYIAGIVQDCQAGPLNRWGSAKAFVYTPDYQKTIILRYQEGKESELGVIEELFYQLYPDRLYTGSIVGPEQLSMTDWEMDYLFTVFLFWAIFGISIMCLGLYGIMINIAVHRKREFSIRRVFGSDLMGIFQAVIHKVSYMLGLGVILGMVCSYLIFNEIMKLTDLPINDRPIHYIIPVILLLTTVLIIILSRVKIILWDNPATILKADY